MIKNDNTGSDRGGGIAQANNGGRTTINMYDGAEICRNSSTQTGGGVMVSNGVFNMYGGTISENTAKQQGGGVFVRRAGQFNMSGGVITGNSTDEFEAVFLMMPATIMAVCPMQILPAVRSAETARPSGWRT